MKVLNHTPAWLARPSVGFDIFQQKDTKSQNTLNSNGKKLDYRGPCKTLAHRGTEVIFVIGNEIRWADLIALKEAGKGADLEKLSKTLKAPVAGQIRQLVVSPLGDYLAIVTSHTVHVAILPTRLDSPETGPLRLKTFQLGPTAHVLEQSPLAAVVWHPLGVLGSCLVTVASDACIRVWELNKDSRHSFDEPALAIDLKKLANASSYGEDMRASVYGTSKGFSPDQVEMEVAAACFGGIASPDESGWAAMTLWLAMTEGDVYAISPLLPSKWQPSSTTIPSLSTGVVSKVAILDQDPDATEEGRRIAVQQQKWLADIDSQEPLLELLPTGLETVEVYHRPSHPPAIPKLQGPFRLQPDPELVEVSDMFVIAPRLDVDSNLDVDEDDLGLTPPRTGSSVGIIAIVTQPSSLHICLDTVGVEAMWLPSRKTSFKQPYDGDDSAALLVLDSVNLDTSGTYWSSITPNLATRYLAEEPLYQQDPIGRYGFYVTTSQGVHSCDLNTWLANLEDELGDPSDAGASFRIGLLYEGDSSQIDQMIKAPSSPNAAAISLYDSDLGHFILTIAGQQPLAVTAELPQLPEMADPYAPDDSPQLLLTAPENREAYIPPSEFFASTQLPCFLDQTLHSGKTRLTRQDLKSQVRLSPATLQIMTEAHRLMSDETNRLGLAAADLFRRCQRMQAELTEQIRRVREITERAEYVTSHDEDGRSKQQGIEARLNAIRERDEKLQSRTDALRRKVAGLNGKELSQREEAWKTEVADLEARLEGEGQTLAKRVGVVKEMKTSLVKKAEEIRARSEKEEKGEKKTRVPEEVRQRRIDAVMGLLDRETALVEAVAARLGRLGGLGGQG